MSKVLVVDDELFYREMVTDVLAKAGHKVLQAKDGKEALNLISKGHTIESVLLDVVMPGMDGLAVLSKIRSNNSHVPVIMLSAHDEKRMVLQALRRGAFDYQVKPLSPQELVLAVERAMEYCRLQRDQKKKLDRLASLESGARQLSTMVTSDIKIEALAEEYDLLESAVKMVADLLECERVSIMLLDTSDNSLKVAVSVGMSKTLIKEESRPAKKSMSSHVFETGEALLVTDVAEDERVSESEYSSQYKTPSFVIAPLIIGEKIVGVINGNDKKDRSAFDEDDLYLLRTMSHHVSAALQLGIQVSEIERDRSRLGRLIEFQKILIHYLEPEEMLHDLVKKCQDMLNVVCAAVFLKDDFSEHLELKVGYNGEKPMTKKTIISMGESITGKVAEQGKMFLSNDPAKDKRYIAEVEWPWKGVIKNMLVAPIKISRSTIGVIRLLNKRGDPFVKEDAELLKDVADSLAIAIRNMKLYEQLNHSVEEIIGANRNLQKLNDELKMKAKEAESLKKMLAHGGG